MINKRKIIYNKAMRSKVKLLKTIKIRKEK